MIFILKFFLPKNVRWIQWTGCLATTLSMFAIGLMIGWISPHLARSTASKNFPLLITMNEASWMISMHSLGCILGSIFGGTSAYYFGSKRTLILNVVPMLCCWSFIITADFVSGLYLARLANGFSLGATWSSFSLYLGEVGSPEIRGTLISLATIGYPLGILMGSMMGVYLSVSRFAWTSLAPTVGTILLFMWVPESPHYLIRMGKMRRTWNSILRYNPKANVQIEFETLKNFVAPSTSPTFADCWREFISPQNRKSITLAMALFVFMQANGLETLTIYSEVILIRGGFNAIAPSAMVIILNLVGILSGLSAICLADKYGRRILWRSASIGSCISLFMIGIHFSFLDESSSSKPSTMQWFLMIALVIWQISTHVGVIPIPCMILGELFSPNTKSFAASLANIAASVIAFLFSMSYEPIVNAAGETCVFWIHAILMLVAVTFGFTFLPETKGKSLVEIQDSLFKE